MSSDERDDSGPTGPPRVLTFHKLSDGYPLESTCYALNRFEKLLGRLIDEGYRLRSADQLSTTTDGGEVVISFDDGFAHLHELLPRLIERFQLKPIIFMPTDYIGRTNSWDYSHVFRRVRHLGETEIRELAALGVIFGSHGCSHSDLTGLDQTAVEDELVRSREILRDITGQSVDTISYPFGRQNSLVREGAAGAGYSTGFTMAFPESGDNPLAQGRYAVYNYDTFGSIKRKLEQGAFHSMEKIKAGLTNRLGSGTILLNRLRGLNKPPHRST